MTKTYRLAIADHLIFHHSEFQSMPRVYTREAFQEAIDRCMQNGPIYGELGRTREMSTDRTRLHTIDQNRVSHAINNIRITDDGDVIGDVTFLQTPNGIVAERMLHEEGSNVGFGLRGESYDMLVNYPTSVNGGNMLLSVREMAAVVTFDLVWKASNDFDILHPHSLFKFDPTRIVQDEE